MPKSLKIPIQKANRRLLRLQEHDLNTPAYRAIRKKAADNPTLFYFNKDGFLQIRNTASPTTMRILTSFLNAKTSTISGATASRAKSKKSAAKKQRKKLTPLQEANKRLRDLQSAEDSLKSQALSYIRTKAYQYPSFFNTNKKGQLQFKKSSDPMARRLLSGFLEAKTSTVKGTREKYKKSYDTFNKNRKKRGKPPLTYDDYVDLWETSKLKSLAELYGSDEIIDTVSEIGINEAGGIMEHVQDFIDTIRGDSGRTPSLRAVNDFAELAAENDDFAEILKIPGINKADVYAIADAFTAEAMPDLLKYIEDYRRQNRRLPDYHEMKVHLMLRD